ncbi:hypothetical protein EMMF5_002534 [Cystobasidiomycetes sp. EMM_F5]
MAIQRLDSSPVISKVSGKAVSSGRGHARGRSASGSSHGSGSISKSVTAFPVLTPTPETLLEHNPSDILWKTFVAFEQDCRDTSNLMPLLCNIESTVASAVDPLALAGDALDECARHVDNDFRDAIEQALANATSASPGSAYSDGPKPATSPTAHAKQLSLASSRISSVCSTFRATQTSLRYYGGARKTAYQLDLFVHKYALPTSTSLHKKGQEYNAVNKWIKKALAGESRMLDALDMAALRRAANALEKWTETMRTHAALLRKVSTEVRALMQERASLHAYSFPPRAIPAPIIAPTPVNPADSLSPLLQYTNVNLLESASFTASSATGSVGTFEFFSPLLTGAVPPSLPPASSSFFPQSCANAFVTSPVIADQSQYQYQWNAPFTPSAGTPLDISISSDLFFDGLCM